MSTHKCPGPRCGFAADVPRAQLACRRDWYAVTPATRARVYSAYKYGTTEQHHAAINAAIDEMQTTATVHGVNAPGQLDDAEVYDRQLFEEGR